MTRKTIEVSEKMLALCGVKVARASDLDRDQTASLMAWCDCQTEDLWDGLSLQEILNVYRVSAEWETWQSWAEDETTAARRGWNKAVRRENRMALT